MPYKNPEDAKENKKKYREANKEKLNAAQRERAKNNRKTEGWKQNKHLKARYGITLEERNKMLEEQGGVCAICDEPMKKICVDHNHTTGKIRELLCGACNTAFGFFKEDPRLLEKAAMYARFHNGTP
jgi:hypothetical protein